MPVKEESFRIGSGRYIQGSDYAGRCGEEVLRLGTSPLIVGGETALEKAREKIEKGLSKKCNKYEFIVHKGSCNDEDGEKIAQYAINNGYDVIVGVGGGVICDFAKLCGYHGKFPVINIPTSSATCASYTPLSVRYTPRGETVGSIHYDYEVDCVIADTKIISAQPIRLFLSGVFDALAKFVEIKQRFSTDAKDFPMGLDYAYVMSEYSHNFLTDNVQKCIDHMKNGEISDIVEKVIFTLIAATGVISGIARGSNQTALAHKFYETVRYFYPEKSMPYLHGEIVGVGLLLQNHFNGEEENNQSLIKLMRKYDMPCCLKEIGAENTDEMFEKFYEKICTTSAVNKEDKEECERFKKSLEYLWRLNNNEL